MIFSESHTSISKIRLYYAKTCGVCNIHTLLKMLMPFSRLLLVYQCYNMRVCLLPLVTVTFTGCAAKYIQALTQII